MFRVVGYWFDESVCSKPFTLNNIYYHVWISSIQEGEANYKIGWIFSRGFTWGGLGEEGIFTDYCIFILTALNLISLSKGNSEL